MDISAVWKRTIGIILVQTLLHSVGFSAGDAVEICRGNATRDQMLSPRIQLSQTQLRNTLQSNPRQGAQTAVEFPIDPASLAQQHESKYQDLLKEESKLQQFKKRKTLASTILFVAIMGVMLIVVGSMGMIVFLREASSAFINDLPISAIYAFGGFPFLLMMGIIGLEAWSARLNNRLFSVEKNLGKMEVVQARKQGMRMVPESKTPSGAKNEAAPGLLAGGRVFAEEGEYWTLNEFTQHDLGCEALFAKIDRTITILGYNRLRWYLIHPLLEVAKVHERQNTVGELIRKENMREKLEQLLINMRDIQNIVADASPLNSALTTEFSVKMIFGALISIGVFSGIVPSVIMVLLIAGAGLGIMKAFDRAKEIRSTWRRVSRFVSETTRLLDKAEAPLLMRIRDEMISARDLSQDKGFARFMRRPTLFNTWWAYRYRSDKLERILGVIGELEALYSLAQAAVDNLGYESFPEVFDDSVPTFKWEQVPELQLTEVEQGHHPLLRIEESVPNSIALGLGRSFLILSGVNLGGKSTFLRKVAIMTIFAQIGSPVRGKSMRLTPAKIMSLVSLEDDLQGGKSLYDVETDILLEMINLAISDKRAFLLFDEMFRGTNPRDRVITKQVIIPFLASLGIRAILSTHDLTDTELANQSSPNIFNKHFTERLDETGTPRPDFTLQDGPVTSSNAIEILKRKGYPPAIIDAIMTLIDRINNRTDSSGLKPNIDGVFSPGQNLVEIGV